MKNIPLLIKAVAITFPLLSILAEEGQAQMNNKPFGFKNSPDGGIGMSVGGKQAILDDKLFNSQPENLHRDASGALLDVQKGPGGSAIVSRYGTAEFIPQYHGRSFRENNPAMTVGVFNTYFVPSYIRSGFSNTSQMHSGATVSTWTARIVSGGAPVSYQGNNTVETWTEQVLLIGN